MTASLAIWIDLAILVLLAVYAWDGWKRGFIIIAVEVAGFLVSIFGALLLYAPIGGLLADTLSMTRGFSKAAGFVLAWMVIALVYMPLARFLYRKVPQRFR